MSKLTKNIGLCGAIILIVFDVWYICDCFSLKGASLLNHILNTTLPCGLLLGIFAFLVLLEKSGKKPLGIASIIVFGIMAILRLIASIIFIVDKIKEMDTLGYSFEELLNLHGFAFVKFLAVAPLLVSTAFLVIYILKGAFKKTTQVVASVAIIALACVWIYTVYQLVSLGMESGHNIVQIYMDFFETELIWELLSFAGYAFVIGSLTGAMENKE